MDVTNVCPSPSLGPGNAVFNQFLLTMATIHCNITGSTKWPDDYGEKALHYGLGEYDFVVVGAGTAGSVVAGRLADNEHAKVLLLEAGDNPPVESEVPGFFTRIFGSTLDWNYRTEPDKKSCVGCKGETCPFPKGKVLGGSHAFNGLAYIRAPPSDFDEWESAGNPSWGWNHVQYYFSNEDNALAGGDAMPIPDVDKKILTAAASERGHNIIDNLSDGPQIGFGTVRSTLRSGSAVTTAKVYLLKERPNLHIIKNAYAYKIDFTKDKRAQRVRFTYKDGYEMKVEARKEIILSAGSIETPKLLMLSGIGPKSHLKSLGIPVVKDLPVGYNLQDHVRVDAYVRYKPGKDKDVTKDFLDTIYNHWVHGNGPFSSTMVDAAGFLATDDHPYLPDIQILARGVDNITAEVGRFKERIGDSIARQIGSLDRVLATGTIVLKPRSRGYLKLRSKDYRHEPYIYRNFFDQYDDLKRAAKALKEFSKFENTDAFKKIDGEFIRPHLHECDHLRYRSLKYWECYSKYMSNTIYHYAGTAKMGPKWDKWAVVNPKLEVYGVKGLRVVDASIMPSMVRADINPAVIVVGEKGADFIKSKWNL